MKIYLALKTAGKYGGLPNGNVRNFYHVIQTALDNSGFSTSFDELWLTLAYPPMYTLPGVVGIEKDFQKYYDTLPYIRLNRKNKTIDITLKAPEFSENLDKAEQHKYEHKFDIKDQYKNISETKLAAILIDKYVNTGEIINSKLKMGDVFDFNLFENTLLSIQQQITPEYLEISNAKVIAEIEAKSLERAIELRENRKKNCLPKDTRIRDIRVYYANLPNAALYPYDYQYTEIFRNILRKKGLMCPKYHHLYIEVGKTINECLLRSFAVEDWHIYGLSVIDYDDYLNKSENEKEKTVFNIIVKGLKDIESIDKLDDDVIESAINEIKLKGLDTELEYKTLENNKHKLVISYLSRSMEEQCPIYFTLIEKATSRYNKIQIGRADNFQIHYWLQKVTLTSAQIKVKSSNSIAADVYLKGKVRNMEFTINDILNG